MRTLLIGLLMAVLIVGVFAPPADAWGRHGYWHWGPLGILAAPLVVAGVLVTAPFVIIGSAVAAATPPVVVSPPPVVMPAPRMAPAPMMAPAPRMAPPPMMASAPVAPSYWYYCEDPAGYHPYVAQCPGGWLPVVPRARP
jgi:hypothetical protein